MMETSSASIYSKPTLKPNVTWKLGSYNTFIYKTFSYNRINNIIGKKMMLTIVAYHKNNKAAQNEKNFNYHHMHAGIQHRHSLLEIFNTVSSNLT